LRHGPTLFEQVANADGSGSHEEPSEYAVTLIEGADPETLDEDAFRSRDEWDRYAEYAAESKIGGTPAFWEYPEYPDSGHWRLLLQLNSAIVPPGPNFGDGGCGYIFRAEDGASVKFFWQG